MFKEKQFIYILTAILMTGFIAVSTLSYFSARSSLSEQIVKDILPITGDSVYSQIKQQLLEPVSIATMMAHDTFLRDWVLDGERDTRKITRFLKEVQSKYNTTTSFFVSAKTLNYYHPSGIVGKVHRDVPEDIWFFRVSEMPGNYEINIDLEHRVQRILTVFINYKVYDYDNNFIGVAGVGISANSLRHLIERYHHEMDLEIFFANRNGDILLSDMHSQKPDNLRDIPGLAPHVERILRQESSQQDYPADNTRVHLNSRLIDEFNWFLMIERKDTPWDIRIWGPLLVNLIIGLLVSLIIIYSLIHLVERYQAQLRKMAITDNLSGALSRHGLDEIWCELVDTNQKGKGKIHCLLIDIDHFKRINDQHGHLTGDQVIVDVCQTVRTHMSSTNALVRWGGEEFLILLPDSSEMEAMETAERIRLAVNNNVRVDEFEHVTISIGVSACGEYNDPDAMIHLADTALYQAKSQGRNQVKNSTSGNKAGVIQEA